MRKFFLKWQTNEGIKAGWVSLPDLPDEELVFLAKGIRPPGTLEKDEVIFVGELIGEVETKILFSIKGENK